MSIATYLSWSDKASISLAIILAFIFGYAFSVVGLVRNELGLSQAVRLAVVADTASIVLMELIANLVIWFWPGALDAELANALYWISLGIAFIIAFMLTIPLNRWLIARGKGHAVVHKHHRHAHE